MPYDDFLLIIRLQSSRIDGLVRYAAILRALNESSPCAFRKAFHLMQNAEAIGLRATRKEPYDTKYPSYTLL